MSSAPRRQDPDTENDQDDADQCNVKWEDLGALPDLVAAGASDLRAVLMWASECFALHHGVRAADPGEFAPAWIKPSLSLGLVHLGC